MRYDCSPILEKLGPIKLTLSGLEIMNDDPSTVDVLYGCIQETQWSNDGTFQNLLDKIVDFFSRKGMFECFIININEFFLIIN